MNLSLRTPKSSFIIPLNLEIKSVYLYRMQKSLQILLALYCAVFLFLGNPISYFSSQFCKGADGTQSQCEMECCKTDCCSNKIEGPVLTSVKECCEIQQSTNTNQLYEPITLKSNPDKSKISYVTYFYSPGKTFHPNLINSSPPGKGFTTYLELHNLRL